MIDGYALTQGCHRDTELPGFDCYFKLLKSDVGGQLLDKYSIREPVLWVMLARNDLFDPWRVLGLGSRPWVELDGDQGGPEPVGDLPGDAAGARKQ